MYMTGTRIPSFPELMPWLCPIRLQFTPSEANARLAPDTGIIYPEQSVDGRVDELGGAALRRACAALPVIGAGEARCEVGAAVWTRAEGA